MKLIPGSTCELDPGTNQVYACVSDVSRLTTAILLETSAKSTLFHWFRSFVF